MRERRNGSGGRGGVLGTLLRYELRMLLRDTRTLLIAVVAPLLILPAWILITRTVERSEERRLDDAEYRFAVTGSLSDWGRQQVVAALRLDASDPDTTRRAARFVEVPAGPEPDSALRAGEFHVLVEAMTWDEYQATVAADRAEAQDSTSAEEAQAAPEPPPVRTIRLKYRALSDFSRNAEERLWDRLLELRRITRDSVYQASGFPVPVAAVAVAEGENVATAAREAGALLGLVLTPLLLLLMLSGGSIVAADAISGEKERGTLETLLTTAASRREIVRAKQLAVIVVGVVVAAVNAVNLAVYLGLGVVELPASLQISLSPAQAILVLLLFIPLAILVSAVLLLVSGASKSYREYQIYFFPVLVAFLVPSLAALLPGMELRSVIAVVPVAGISVAVREIMLGDVDWLFSGIAFAGTASLGLFLAGLTERTLSNERLISRSGMDEADFLGGEAVFPKHVFRWFLGMWVVFFVSSLWLGETIGLRGQVFLNLVVIFLGGSILVMRRYRLPVRETLSLRAPHPAAWVATVVGAPSALVVGLGLAELVNAYLFPVPQEVIEAFGQSLAGPQLPLWQMVLFLAVMPGVLEEIAFRGVLLHGVRRRFGPWATALVVGAIFGFFHVALFRIVPTAFLGVILASVVLLTRSLYPAILWHFLNNAAAVVPNALGWLPDEFSVPPWGTAVALFGLILAFWILVRTSPGREDGKGAHGSGPDSALAEPAREELGPQVGHPLGGGEGDRGGEALPPRA